MLRGLTVPCPLGRGFDPVPNPARRILRRAEKLYSNPLVFRLNHICLVMLLLVRDIPLHHCRPLQLRSVPIGGSFRINRIIDFASRCT